MKLSYQRYFLLTLLVVGSAVLDVDAHRKVPSVSVVVGERPTALPSSVEHSVRGGGTTKAPPSPPLAASGSGTATIPNEVFNLVKNIVGAGVLSLPAGVAAFGNAPSALIPALSLIAVIGCLSAFGFACIGKVCAYTGATSYREAWEKTVGPSTSWIPASSATFMTFSACLAYSMILADTFAALLRRPAQRKLVLMGITTFILLPLCWMKELSSLAPFSLLGVMGMGFTAIAMTLRYLDGSYQTGSKLLESVAEGLRPSFGMDGWQSVFRPSALILVSMLSTAYMCHFNASKFYLELRNNTLPRYHQVVGYSFGISILLMGFLTAMGFLTFGANSDGLVLNNYAAGDVWIGASRIAVALSLVFSYPLAFQGCRDGVLDLLKVPPSKRSNATLNVTTVAVLALLTLLAATLTDVSFVLSFGGATLGNLLTYIYPAIMYYKMVALKKLPNEGFGVTLSIISAILGTIMGGIGAKQAIDAM